MSTGSGKTLISVQPEELKFHYELEKQSFCDLKVVNNTEHYVAFKVKTTSPKKYFVRPNSGVVHSWDSCVIRVTLQAQREYPLDMVCKDKFLLQSTVMPSKTDELPPDTFNKESGKIIEECRLRVVYIYPNSVQGNSEDETLKSLRCGSGSNTVIQHLKDERDTAVQQTQQLQQELDMLKRRRYRKNGGGFTFKFAVVVVVVGFLMGFILKLFLSAPSID